jgi:hypothetical protein
LLEGSSQFAVRYEIERVAMDFIEKAKDLQQAGHYNAAGECALISIAESLKTLATQQSSNTTNVIDGAGNVVATHSDSDKPYEVQESELAGVIYRAWDEQSLPTDLKQVARKLLQEYNIERKS